MNNANNNAPDKGINNLRNRIDEIDKGILDLINSRLAITQKIGLIKKEIQGPILDADREKRIIERLNRLNNGPLGPNSLNRIFNTIMTESKKLQNYKEPAPDKEFAPHLFCIFGNPIAHSLSPLMHNRAFAITGYNGIFLPFAVERIEPVVSAIKILNIKGASITIPHKVAIIDHLDELDDVAMKIGAVNTVVNKDGKLIGYNTDSSGAMKALTEKTTIRGKQVSILGAGGAARAIGYGILAEGGKITIINRSSRGESLAIELGANFLLLSDINKLYKEGKCDILINTTPVGMFPEIDASPVPTEIFQKEMTIMDAVYNPQNTALIKAARKIGCKTITGDLMFVYQGACQFELWTKKKPPIDDMKQTVYDALTINRNK